jgi:hypothetical protein
MSFILDGSPGFILLAIVVALGAYLRQADVAAREEYDKIKRGELAHSWPKDKPYTTRRLTNLESMDRKLRFITNVMFFFMVLMAVRLSFNAVRVMTDENTVLWHWLYRMLYLPDWIIYIWDLVTMIFLVVAFSVMWWMHWRTSSILEGIAMFKVGDAVIFKQSSIQNVPGSICVVTKVLPDINGKHEYRVKSADEELWIAQESQLEGTGDEGNRG